MKCNTSVINFNTSRQSLGSWRSSGMPATDCDGVFGNKASSNRLTTDGVLEIRQDIFILFSKGFTFYVCVPCIQNTSVFGTQWVFLQFIASLNHACCWLMGCIDSWFSWYHVVVWVFLTENDFNPCLKHQCMPFVRPPPKIWRSWLRNLARTGHSRLLYRRCCRCPEIRTTCIAWPACFV